MIRQLVSESAAQTEAWPADRNLGIISIYSWVTESHREWNVDRKNCWGTSKLTSRED